MKFVTSLNSIGYNLYGKIFIDSFIKYLPNNELHIYTEGFKLKSSKNIIIHSLEKECTDLFEFRDKFKHIKKPDSTYRYQWEKFAGKSWTIYRSLKDKIDKSIIWLDSDIIIHKDPTELFLLFFKGEYCNYLGRIGMHTETGFLSFDTTNKFNEYFCDKFIDIYKSGVLFKLKEWHDCEVFDETRKLLNGLVTFNNLTPKAKKGDHVFIKYFYPYMDHKKGYRRKILGYSPEIK